MILDTVIGLGWRGWKVITFWKHLSPPFTASLLIQRSLLRTVIRFSIITVQFTLVEVIAWYFPSHLHNYFTGMRHRYAMSVINKPFRRYKGGRASKSLLPLRPLIIHIRSSLTCYVWFAVFFGVLPVDRLFNRYGRSCIGSFIYLINGYWYSSCSNHCCHIWLL